MTILKNVKLNVAWMWRHLLRHPEFISGPRKASAQSREVLKRVQDDECSAPAPTNPIAFPSPLRETLPNKKREREK
tara:strand:+ start:53793 stop:54020 length:228 start_codon:yes stop_codon:yes gene_type:complete